VAQRARRWRGFAQRCGHLPGGPLPLVRENLAFARLRPGRGADPQGRSACALRHSRWIEAEVPFILAPPRLGQGLVPACCAPPGLARCSPAAGKRLRAETAAGKRFAPSYRAKRYFADSQRFVKRTKACADRTSPSRPRGWAPPPTIRLAECRATTTVARTGPCGSSKRRPHSGAHALKIQTYTRAR